MCGSAGFATQYMAQEKPTKTQQRTVLTPGSLNEHETLKSWEVRDKFLQRPEYLNRVINEKRQKFAKLLREMGEMNDGI